MSVDDQEPQSAEPWSGIWDASTVYECMQLNTLDQDFQVVGTEDCLYLNVYIPKIQPLPTHSLDVVVYIHGGAFMYGSPSQGGPEYLMDRDIVYVNFNYRVGVLGFLSTEDDVVSGNNGLKDQVMVLKWVQANILQFGGNPESVTIIGLSAGGASVHFHYFSPLSKGLFHRGISQSGTALVPWAIQKASLEKARKLASSVGCDSQSTQELVKCLQQRSGKQIVQNTDKFFGYREYPLAPFAPVIENMSETAFLTEHPITLLNKGYVHDIPWITSVTTEEGIFPVATFIDKLDEIDKNWNEILPYLLDYNYTASNSYRNVIADRIKAFYFNNETLSLNNIQNLIKLFGDRYFKLGFEIAARMHSKAVKSPVYSYIYGYKGEQSLSNIFKLNKRYGVAHGEDGFLLYYVTLFGVTVNKEELLMCDEFIKDLFLNIITSFARNGKPEVNGVEWRSVNNSADLAYLFIHKPSEIKMAFHNEELTIEYWNNLQLDENENTLIKDEL